MQGLCNHAADLLEFAGALALGKFNLMLWVVLSSSVAL